MGRKIAGLDLLYALMLALFFLTVVLPVLYAIVWAFVNLGRVNLEFAYLSGLLLKSIILAGCTGFLSVLFGSLLAFVVYRTGSGRFLTFVLLLVPLFLPPYFMAVGWRRFWVDLFAGKDSISSFIGVIWVLTLVYTPLAMLIIGSALRNVAKSYEEAGLLVTTRSGVVLKIIIPLIKPALLSSFVLVFVFALSEFSVPAYFGVQVFSTEIFTQFSAFYDFSLAIAESLVLIFVSLFFLLTGMKYLSKTHFMSVGSGGQESKIYKFGAGRILVWFWIFLSTVLPLLSVLSGVLKKWENIRRAFDLLLEPARVSFLLSTVTALIIVFAGFVYAFYVRKKGGGKIFLLFMLLIFALPSATLGISLIKFYNRALTGFIYSSFLIVVIGLWGKFLFIGAKILEDSLGQIPNSLDEAAAISGIPLFRRIVKIWLPLSLDAIFSVFVIAFVLNFTEIAVSIMVYPPGSELLSVKVFTLMSNAPVSLTYAMVLAVIVFTSLSVLALFVVRRVLGALLKF